MMPSVSSRQGEIAAALKVVPPFADEGALLDETARRIAFLQDTLQQSRMKTLVLGISGGVDSLLAGRLAQLAVEGLRARTHDRSYRFIAVRLPHGVQHDERDARAALDFIRADEEITVPIEAGVTALTEPIAPVHALPDRQRDFVLGNVKARLRMVAQYAIANACGGLVIGTDHAAEAVMGFFTKFGDGACDLAPLYGLVKGQICAIARHLGAPAHLVNKTPTADLEALCPGKPDEEAHGVRYADIDAFLHGQPVSAEASARILATYDASAHKRAPLRVP